MNAHSFSVCVTLANVRVCNPRGDGISHLRQYIEPFSLSQMSEACFDYAES